jgi:soluble lytic murein transglycosylase-like protein
MGKKKRRQIFGLTGLTLWSFAFLAMVAVITQWIKTDINDNLVLAFPVDAPKAAKQATPEVSFQEPVPLSMAVPQVPELPPSSDLPRIRHYNLIAERAAVLYRIDTDLLRAMIMVESRYKPLAASEKSAQGLMQILPRTAAELGVRDIHDPEENILAGAKYFRYLLERFEGDTELALAAYNAGYRKVLRYKGIPPYPETRAYIANVFKYFTYFKIESLRKRGVIGD